jgi:hypothetical protein
MFQTPYSNMASRLYDPAKAVSAHISLPAGTEIPLLQEHLLPVFAHALSLQDIEETLARVPVADLEGISWILQLQPTRKELVLRNSWAIYFHDLEIGRKRGEAIVLNARRPDERFFWDSSLRPVDTRELNKLRDEGHRVDKAKNGYWIVSPLQAISATQRRSLLHEVGHHVDYARGHERYLSQTVQAQEAFAERYASSLGS